MEINQIYQIFKANHFAFTTDSRNVKKNDLFFALKGGNFNGNKYALKAIEAGASYAVVDEEEYAIDDRFILVKDVLHCFQNLATHHRLEFPIPFIAIGGSNGKTTSKELIKHVLAEKYKVHCTKGNFNNLIGVPITLLELPEDADIAIVEVGTNTFGEIAQLAEIVRPTHGVITNIGKEHLEGFGDLEGVAKEESELYYYIMKNHGTVFVNADDEWLMRMASRLEHVNTYGSKGQVSTTLLQSMPHLRLEYKGLEISSSLFGEHNYQNVNLAIAIGQHFGLSPEQIEAGISKYKPDNNRSQVEKVGSNTLILDAYNANPSSVLSVLDSFCTLQSNKKVVILGDMFELGEKAEEEHKAIADYLVEHGLESVFLVGNEYKKLQDQYGFKFFETVDGLNEHLGQHPIEDAHVLIKGSRGVKLEQLSLIEA